MNISLNQFWANAGAPHQGSFAFDPRVLFDDLTQRWFACAVDDAGTINNGILIAISNTHDPMNGWTGFRIDADTDNLQWADFPTMGMNMDGLVVKVPEKQG